MITVEQYLNATGRVVGTPGKEIFIECPWCEGKRCSVRSTDGLFHCWGCGEGGSFKKIQEKIGRVEEIDVLPPDEKDPPPKIDPTDIFKYQVKLQTHPDLIKWLVEKKGINKENIIKYQIGWDGRNIVFPIRDIEGNYLNIKFRRDPTLPVTGKSVWSLPGSKAQLFNEEVLVSAKQVIICEGEWDVILLSQMGYKAVTGTAGAMGFNERWIAKFNKDQDIYICYDSEASGVGEEGMIRTQKFFTQAGLHADLIKLPRTIEEKVDISDYFLDKGHTKEDFDTLITESTTPKDEEKYDYGDASTHITDMGNAYKIAEMFGNRVRFDHRRGRWLVWRGHRWVNDDDKTVKIFAMEMAKQRRKEAAEIEDSEKSKNALKKAFACEAKSKIDAALDLLKSIKPISDTGENWDGDNMLLSCENGIVDLTTGKRRDGKPEDRVTMSTGIYYDPDADCPRFKQFIEEIFEGDQELIRYVHKALGYSITGSVREQSAYFCFGTGSNGKSVLFKSIANVLGDYAYDAPVSLLTRSYNTNATNDVAATEFKRFLVSSEVLSTGKLNEQRLKKWTGGDRETARYLYGEFFTFEPTVKPWLFINHKPRVDDDSHGFWRRVRLLPFERVFKISEQDPDLLKRLKEESPGILNWLIEGCLLWQREGLSVVPEKVLGATRDYQAENDVLAEFVYSELEISDDGVAKASEVYKRYVEWADKQGLQKGDVLSNNSFGRKMSDKYPKIHQRDGWYYRTVILKNTEMGTKNTQNSFGDGFVTDSTRGGDGLDPIFHKTNTREDNSKKFMKNDPQSVTLEGAVTDNPSHNQKNDTVDENDGLYTQQEIDEIFK